MSDQRLRELYDLFTATPDEIAQQFGLRIVSDSHRVTYATELIGSWLDDSSPAPVASPSLEQPTSIGPREATWGPKYQQYHVQVVEAIRARMFARWPPKTIEERRTLENNLRFFDEACDYLEEFGEQLDPMEMADDQIDAAL